MIDNYKEKEKLFVEITKGFNWYYDENSLYLRSRWFKSIRGQKKIF
jgi:hypothetical protein